MMYLVIAVRIIVYDLWLLDKIKNSAALNLHIRVYLLVQKSFINKKFVYAFNNLILFMSHVLPKVL